MKIIETEFSNEINSCEYNLWTDEETKEHVIKCVKIANDHAIRFTLWLVLNKPKFGDKKLRELLEIFNEETDF